MVSSPRMQVKRPIVIPFNLYPLESVFPFIDHAMNQGWLLRGWSGRDLIAFVQQGFCARSLCFRVAVYGAERFAGRNFVAELLMNDDAYGGIDGIFFFFPASPEGDAGGVRPRPRACCYIDRLAGWRPPAGNCGRS